MIINREAASFGDTPFLDKVSPPNHGNMTHFRHISREMIGHNADAQIYSTRLALEHAAERTPAGEMKVALELVDHLELEGLSLQLLAILSNLQTEWLIMDARD